MSFFRPQRSRRVTLLVGLGLPGEAFLIGSCVLEKVVLVEVALSLPWDGLEDGWGPERVAGCGRIRLPLRMVCELAPPPNNLSL